MAMEPLRILADRIVPLHWGLIAEAIDRCENVEVVARDVSPAEMPAALQLHTPDILILAAPDLPDQPELLDDWLRSGRPARRIMTLTRDPSVVQLRRWRLDEVTLRDVSLDSLCDAIRGAD